MFCSSDSWDSAIGRSSEPRSPPLAMESFYFLYSPCLLLLLSTPRRLSVTPGIYGAVAFIMRVLLAALFNLPR